MTSSLAPRAAICYRLPSPVSAVRCRCRWADFSRAYVAATVQPDFTAKAVKQALSPRATPPTYKYPLVRTDFVFRGSPTQQKNCAAMVQKIDDQRQMAALCLNLFKAAQQLPDFRKNNLAAGLTLLIGLSFQVSTGSELTDAEIASLQRGLNDLLIDSGVMKLKPAEIQAMYETSVMPGRCIWLAAIAPASWRGRIVAGMSSSIFLGQITQPATAAPADRPAQGYRRWVRQPQRTSAHDCWPSVIAGPETQACVAQGRLTETARTRLWQTMFQHPPRRHVLPPSPTCGR